MRSVARASGVLFAAAALLLPVAAGGAGAAGAAAVSIRGRVDIRRPASPPGTRPAPAHMAQARERTAPFKPAVVYLESAPRNAFEREDARARMDQRDEAFVPHVLAITAGTTVDFPNSDPVFHNVFSLSRTRPFDLGRYAAGKSKSVRFDRPGVVQVFCEIHSHMSAYILVFAHRFFAVTDEDGGYRIDGVPPGTYTLAAWYEGSVRETRSVAVTGDADVPGVDFVVR